MPRKLASRMKLEKYARSRMYAGIQRINAVVLLSEFLRRRLGSLFVPSPAAVVLALCNPCRTDLPRPANLERAAWALVDSEHNVGGQHRKQGIEVTVPRCGDERFRNFALPVQVGVGPRRGAPNPAARPARELPGGVRRAVDDLRDHVIEEERRRELLRETVLEPRVDERGIRLQAELA